MYTLRHAQKIWILVLIVLVLEWIKLAGPKITQAENLNNSQTMDKYQSMTNHI